MPFSMCTDVFPSSILLQPNTWCIRQPFFFFPALLSETIAYLLSLSLFRVQFCFQVLISALRHTWLIRPKQYPSPS